MPHPIESGEVELSVKDGCVITAEVVANEIQADGAYHYHLQATFENGGDAATVQIKDVHESLIILKE